MPDISTDFTVFSSKINSNIPLMTHLNAIRDGEWEDLIWQLRSISDPEEYKRFKGKLPGAIFSGIFSNRSDADLIQHSDFICMDYDGDFGEDTTPLKKLLMGDKFVYALWDSPSGYGLRILFRITGNKHRQAYLGVATYLEEEYGIICDTACVNPSRSFRVSFDPNLYINPEQTPVFTKYVREKKVGNIENFAFAQSDFDNIINQVISRKINICETYEEYLKVGFALSSKFGEAGRQYFHAVASQATKYTYNHAEKQFNYCLNHKNSTKEARISTFYWYCKNAGVKITSEKTNKVRKTTLSSKAAGLSKQQIATNLEKIEGITGVEQLISDVFDGMADVGENDSIIDQLEIFLATNYNLRKNVITRKLERDGIAMEQSEYNTMYIAAKRLLPKANYDLFERLLISNFVKNYNPIKEFFEEKFPEYAAIKRHGFSDDGDFECPYIDRLCSTIQNDSPAFTKYFIKKWLVGIISSIYGEPSPLVLVLIGRVLGTGKTEWLRRLLPKELIHYYAESKLDAGKDDQILMTQKILVMDDEFSGKSKKEAGKFKMITSADIISVREPYGRHNVDLKRICTFCGTSNPKEVVTDIFENRRIIPIQVDMVNKIIYNAVDKTKLFGEVYKLYMNGFDWTVISVEDKKYLNVNCSDYEEVSIEGELVIKYFLPCETHEHVALTSSDIKVEIEQLTQQRLSINNIGKQLTKFNFMQRSVRSDGISSRRWLVKRVNRLNSDNPF